MIEIKKQFTDDPLLDEIIYDISIMGIDCVLKNPTEVDKYETLESMENFALYEACTNGSVLFEEFDYSDDDLKACPLIPDSMIDYYSVYIGELNNDVKNYLLKKKGKEFIDNYIEMNNYYRMLNGLPDYGTTGIKVSECGIDLSDYNIDPNIYLHELDPNTISLLESDNVIDKIYDINKSYEYIKYIGKRKIDIYSARKALNFSVLYLSQSTNSEVYNKFIERLDVNRAYFLGCFYSDAYKLDNDYFDSYIIFMIIINSMLDMITLSHEYLIKREIFDLRTVQYILESNGVKFFSDIPIKYQKRLVRNLNTLIKYKSSDKNIIDICSLFGFDNIDTFKYYLHKNRILTEDGYKYTTKLDEDGNEVEDIDKDFELKFIRVPMDKCLDDVIRDSKNYYSYEEITFQDPTWNGPYNSDLVKSKLLEQDFNAVRTKYISIDTVTEMTNLSFELPYFVNMIINSDTVDKNKLSMFVSSINPTTRFNIFDIFVYLYCLMYIYYDIEDTIIYDRADIMYIKGFNFEVDMNQLATYVQEQGFTLKELGVDGFIVPTKYLSFNQLLYIYTNNKNIHDHLVKCMRTAPNKKMYTIYKNIYDALMISELNTDVYKLPDGTNARTYTEYLKFKNTTLYNSVLYMKSVDESIRKETLSSMINSVCDTVYDYLETEDLKYIFSNLPSISIDHIKKYMEEVIGFFKSYRITMLDVGSIYKIKDYSKPTILDSILYSSNFDIIENIKMQDKIYTSGNLSYTDRLNQVDKIYIDIIRTIEKELIDNIGYRDIIDYLSKFNETEKISIYDAISQISKMFTVSDINIARDKTKHLRVLLDKLDEYRISDTLYIDYTTFKDLYIDSILESLNFSKEKVTIKDQIYRIEYTE